MIKEINHGRGGYLALSGVEVDMDDLLTEPVQQAIQDLKDTFNSIKDKAQGLAMNQIWSDPNNPPFRVFIALKAGQDEPEVFINPRGVGSGGHIKDWESCLSFPRAKPRKISRFKNYTILYTNETGEVDSFKISPPWSRTLQHEMDHLEGKVIQPKSQNARSKHR